MSDAEPPRLPRRNVEVVASGGSVVAGFWQYGNVDWSTLYRWLAMCVADPASEWAVFDSDPRSEMDHGSPHPPGPAIVSPGTYVLLDCEGAPLSVALAAMSARPRISTPQNSSTSDSPYRQRARARDSRCLVTGLTASSRVQAAHIFPRGHEKEWISLGFPEKITDTADVIRLGGPIKIDSLQNVVTLRTDLHDAWAGYEFGVNPEQGYRITSFVNGNADIDGLRLQLNHIRDSTVRPLDELFWDHYVQSVLRHVRGTGEDFVDALHIEDAFAEGSVDLSHHGIWEHGRGRERLELELMNRLFDHRVNSDEDL